MTLIIRDVEARWIRCPIPEECQHVSDFGRIETFDMALVRIRTEDGAVIAIRSRQVRYRRARGRRGYRNALASASSRLARSLIPEIRRVFPPPPRPASRGSRRRRRRAPRRRQ